MKEVTKVTVLTGTAAEDLSSRATGEFHRITNYGLRVSDDHSTLQRSTGCCNFYRRSLMLLFVIVIFC